MEFKEGDWVYVEPDTYESFVGRIINIYSSIYEYSTLYDIKGLNNNVIKERKVSFNAYKAKRLATAEEIYEAQIDGIFFRGYYKEAKKLLNVRE